MAMTRDTFLQLKQQRAASASSSAKSGFRAVLTPHFEKNSSMTKTELAEVDRLNEPIEFDLLTENSVNASSQLTSYPTVSGDTVADHIQREPITISLSGTFSLLGNKPTTFYGDSDRLTNIETLFERIMDEGVLCDIVTMERSSTDSSKQRFKFRSNMALTSIRWTQNQSSLDFSFGFTEALLVDMVEVETDYEDENLPDITDATTSSFSTEFLDESDVAQIVMKILSENGLLETGILEDIVSLGNDGLEALSWLNQAGVYTTEFLAKASLITGSIAVAASTLILSGPIGWAVGIAGLISLGVGVAFTKLANQWKSSTAQAKYGIQAFKKINNNDHSETNRLLEYISGIYSKLDSLSDYLLCYKINSNTAQQCMLNFDDSYYIFEFSKSNTEIETKTINGEEIQSVSWQLKVTNVEDETLCSKSLNEVAVDNIFSCKNTNRLFETTNDTKYRAFIINKTLYAVENTTYENDDAREAAIIKAKSDLTNYVILITQVDMDDFETKLEEYINNAMLV